MKKSIQTFALILIFGSNQFYAQTVKTVEMDELNIPSSPAFVFLDESPANIEKPTNPKALAVSLISVGQGGGTIEFSPYWLYNHPDYTIDDEIENHIPFWQTFAVSLASVKENDVSNVSAGFRVQLLRKYTNEDNILATGKLIESALSTSPPDVASIAALKTQFYEQRRKIKWNIELAGAYSATGIEVKNLTSNRLGAWMNIRHTPKGFPIDFVLLGRYSKTFGELNDLIEDSSFIDFGASISKQTKNFDLQLEYVYRRDTNLDLNFDRLVFVSNYKITDNIVAVASFGKNFDEVQDIFTAFGIKVGLSKQTMKLSN